uniref:Calmodulin-lysine N-methyltransferase n=1 Tax=Pristionchus pacificus TaxID=54126 RepID=A0A2A6B6V3_PRIPA|eukprot:PDM61619.1 methyltransferase [Pristionchus pacificus]
MNSPLLCVVRRLSRMTRTVHLAPISAAGDCSSASIVAAAVSTLRNGDVYSGVVALPSDTLYGVTSMIDYSHKLFEVKRRSQLKPLGLFVAGPDEVAKWAEVTISDDLLHLLLPGPVTLIFNRLPSLPQSFNPETLKVGVRVPLCPIVNDICCSLGAPLAQTSANPSGSPLNPVCVDDFTELHDEIDLIIDGGRIETTAEVVDEMPPARKDPSEEDDPSRPSTSRAFSPVIPPIKRARTSTGVVPSVPRRQSKGGGRQSRIENFIDEKPSSSDPPSIESISPTVSPPPILSSRARVNWRRLGDRILTAKTPPIPSFTLGLFEMKKKEGSIYEIKRGSFTIESDGTELCKSVEDRVRDHPCTMSSQWDKRRDETGRVRVWPGGEAMGYWIIEGIIDVEGRRIMEIGCGSIALPSRIALWKGGKDVKANDGSDECVESVKRSTIGEKIEVEKMEWGKREVKEDEKMDVILAADAVFFERSHDALMDTIDSWMRKGGETWISAPERRGSLQKWKRRVKDDGRWKMEEWKDAEETLRMEDLQDRLLIAVSETADEILKEEEEEGKEKIEIESEVLSLTAGIVWDALAEDWAADLLAFSRHANRETIREDDVRLLMRRNPSLMEEIFGECEGEEGMNTMGGIKRRSTGGRLSGRPQKEPRDDDTTLFDDVTTPQGASSMTSVVPETPNGIIPLKNMKRKEEREMEEG